ncbi:uncharacterized protein I206_107357 [Kwoniella pini CBS 10737]
MDPEDWKRLQTLMYTPYNPPPAPLDIPYEHSNPFSPYTFPRYGWYHPETFSHIHQNPLPSVNTGKSQATGMPIVIPNRGVYSMYPKDPALLPQTWTGGWNNPSNISKPLHKPFGESSDLTWTSPSTGKTYQLPPMPEKLQIPPAPPLSCRNTPRVHSPPSEEAQRTPPIWKSAPSIASPLLLSPPPSPGLERDLALPRNLLPTKIPSAEAVEQVQQRKTERPSMNLKDTCPACQRGDTDVGKVESKGVSATEFSFKVKLRIYPRSVDFILPVMLLSVTLGVLIAKYLII